MSPQQVRVASLLLGETFGQLVERVGTHLIRHGALPMVDIVRGTGMKQVEVSHLLKKLHVYHTYIRVCMYALVALYPCRSSEVCVSFCNIT